MSYVNVTKIELKNNMSAITEPLIFDLRFESLAALKHDIEWKVVYVGTRDGRGPIMRTEPSLHIQAAEDSSTHINECKRPKMASEDAEKASVSHSAGTLDAKYSCEPHTNTVITHETTLEQTVTQTVEHFHSTLVDTQSKSEHHSSVTNCAITNTQAHDALPTNSNHDTANNAAEINHTSNSNHADKSFAKSHAPHNEETQTFHNAETTTDVNQNEENKVNDDTKILNNVVETKNVAVGANGDRNNDHKDGDNSLSTTQETLENANKVDAETRKRMREEIVTNNKMKVSESVVDIILEQLVLGPIQKGVLALELSVAAPDYTELDESSIIGMQALLISGFYRDHEFIRIGYYMNHIYSDADLRQSPPEIPILSKLIRFIIDHPRITKFNIPWDES